MDDEPTRRALLAGGAAAGAAGLAGCGTLQGGSGSSPPVDVRGAIYFPARAFNTYQMWRDYDPAVTERDLGYARRVNLNAVRVWLSYEFWREDRRAHQRALEHLLTAAADRGIRVMVGLFEGVGRPPTRERLEDDDPLTAQPVHSPARRVAEDPSRWDAPRAFVRWFMARYRDDDRLLAVEVMNEPGWVRWQTRFAGGMFETLVAERGRVPLTVGSTSLANSSIFADWGADVLQFHYNFPPSRADYRDLLAQWRAVDGSFDGPVWLTEWQRVRPGGGFFSDVEGSARYPDYASLAPVIREAGVGNFFWSLMVKPAYIRRLRRQGVIGGLFHEDGAVWNVADARAIESMSGTPTFEGDQRREWPDWAKEVPRYAARHGSA